MSWCSVTFKKILSFPCFPVEYSKQEDPHLLLTAIYDASCNVYENMLIAMSPDAYVTAISMGRSLALFNTENGNLEELLEEVHGGSFWTTLFLCDLDFESNGLNLEAV